ncbi:MutS-related protein [Pedobacter nototheniae]|uniref:MutS-related protein n=1 Tax=Pedobacter nototheniae TaxID=2488994 RepID=UPI00103C7434|nr:DNA mismatch repair protein MutS [Pedobacter nototheniae]
MNYILAGLILLSFFFIFSIIDQKRRKRNILEDLKSSWAKEREESINFDKASWYSIYYQEEKSFHTLSDQTMADIDFDQLFAKIDRTNSKVGQQYLYNKLKNPTNNINQLHELNEQSKFFRENTTLREKIQGELIKLNSSEGYSIVLLFNNKLVEKPTWFKWLAVDLFLMVALIILSFKFSICALFFLLLVTFNATFLNYWNKKHLLVFTKSLSQLNILIDVSKRISKENIPFDATKIKESIPLFKKFQKKIRILYQDFSQSNQGDISQIPLYLFELIKAVFLVELFTFFKLMSLLENNQENILNLFQYVGSVDVAISVASLRENTSLICVPEFISPDKKIDIKEIKHPLIKDCISNDVYLDHKSMLITGSNMSGKSTFLRTLAINSLLAQTIFTCYATAYKAPIIKLHTSIRIDDNLFDGKSYFLEEVEVMHTIVNEVNKGYQNLFILDEVFKGTNTTERIAAAKAILSYLNNNLNLVFVATHDIELVTMLEPEYDLYHFTETIEDNELIFDHKLKSGPLKTKNAIKILEISGYPKEIIIEALQISKSLSN